MYLKSFITFFFWLATTLIGGTIIACAGVYLYLTPKLPQLQELSDIQMQTPLTVYSADNQLIGTFGEKKRTPILAEDIPPLVYDAVLAAEDDRFFQHSGVDIKGLLRAVYQLVTTGEIQGGGSTITMQVARNIYLHRGQTFTRKFSEILLSLKIEQQLTKSEIFQLYVNKIFLGKRAYGIGAAAEVYYGKPLDELNLAQIAMIAGLPKGPSIFNPIVNPERAVLRRNWILGRMLSLNMINRTDYEYAVSQPVTAREHGAHLDLDAPYISHMAREQAIELFGDRYDEDGYKVFTTIDSALQREAQQAIQKGLDAFDSRKGYRGPEASLADISSDVDTWVTTLGEFKILGNKHPAVITQVFERSLVVRTRDNKELNLDYTDRMSDLRLFINEDQRSATPLSLFELFAPGDVIRLTPTLDTITQIPAVQGALISVRPQTGEIISLVGGYSFLQSNFNRVTQAVRQPGSSFKPLIYSAALDAGFTPASLINDAPIVLEDEGSENIWRPTNDAGRFNGPTRLRQALYQSRNMVSARLVLELGVDDVRDFVSRYGFNRSDLPRAVSISLGSYATTPLKMAEAYSVLANGGFHIEPYLITRIEDSLGRVVWQPERLIVCDTQCIDDLATPHEDTFLSLSDLLNTSSEPQGYAPRVIDERVSFLIDSMLKDVIRRGTGRRARVLDRPDIAGKTGTTNGPVDAWFSGYQHTVATSVWVGYDDLTKLGSREYGGSAALPIWIDFMRAALDKTPIYDTDIPDGVVSVRVDNDTGLRTDSRNNSSMEYFRRENIPRKDSSHSSNNQNNQDDILDIFN